MGDDTPKYTGRLTLNPIAHIDPIGLIMLFVARFGWAKPVMINSDNFRNRRQGEVLTALAGPVANFVTAFIFLFLTALVLRLGLPVSQGLIRVYFVARTTFDYAWLRSHSFGSGPYVTQDKKKGRIFGYDPFSINSRFTELFCIIRSLRPN